MGFNVIFEIYVFNNGGQVYHENDDGITGYESRSSQLLWKMRFFDTRNGIHLCCRTLVCVLSPRPLLSPKHINIGPQNTDSHEIWHVSGTVDHGSMNE